MLVIFFTDNVTAPWFSGLSKIYIVLNIALSWLSMYASSCVPGIVSGNILDAVNKIWASWVLALTKVLGDSKLIVSNSIMVLNSLLYDNCSWELFFSSFVMNSISSTIQYFLLSVTKSVIVWVKLPVVFSVFLLSWSKVTMSLFVL